MTSVRQSCCSIHLSPQTELPDVRWPSLLATHAGCRAPQCRGNAAGQQAANPKFDVYRTVLLWRRES